MDTDLNREFSREESQMAEKHFRNVSISLAIREMKIKMTLRYHLTPLRMAKIKNTNDSLYWRGCRIRRALLHSWWKFINFYSHLGKQHDNFSDLKINIHQE